MICRLTNNLSFDKLTKICRSTNDLSFHKLTKDKFGFFRAETWTKLNFCNLVHESALLVSCRALLKHSKLRLECCINGEITFLYRWRYRMFCLAEIDCYCLPWSMHRYTGVTSLIFSWEKYQYLFTLQKPYMTSLVTALSERMFVLEKLKLTLMQTLFIRN